MYLLSSTQFCFPILTITCVKGNINANGFSNIRKKIFEGCTYFQFPHYFVSLSALILCWGNKKIKKKFKNIICYRKNNSSSKMSITSSGSYA